MAKNRKKPESRGSHFLLRFPEKLRDQIAMAAEKNNRSVTAEVIDRLEKSLAQSEKTVRDQNAKAAWDAAVKNLSDVMKTKTWSEAFERIDGRLEKLQRTLEVIFTEGK